MGSIKDSVDVGYSWNRDSEAPLQNVGFMMMGGVGQLGVSSGKLGDLLAKNRFNFSGAHLVTLKGD